MEFGSEDPEGPNINAFLWFIIRHVNKTYFKLYFRNAQIAKASSQVPHNWKHRKRKYTVMIGTQPPSSDQNQHLNLFKPNFS